MQRTVVFIRDVNQNDGLYISYLHVKRLVNEALTAFSLMQPFKLLEVVDIDFSKTRLDSVPLLIVFGKVISADTLSTLSFDFHAKKPFGLCSVLLVECTYQAGTFKNGLKNRISESRSRAGLEIIEFVKAGEVLGAERVLIASRLLNHSFESYDKLNSLLKEKLQDEHLQKSFFTATFNAPMPRWIHFEGVLNARDLGGYTKTFPLGFIYRSAALNKITQNGMDTLCKKVALIFDLRSMPEVDKNGVFPNGIALYPSTRRCFVPIFPKDDYAPDIVAKRMKSYQNGSDGFVFVYRGILDFLGPTLRTLFRETAALIKSNDPRGILIHCTAGKDRTGIICALLLLLAGVDEETVSLEYALTEAGLESFYQEMVFSNPRLTSEKKVVARRMLGAPVEAMRKTLDIIQKEYGGWRKIVEKNVDLHDLHVVESHLKNNSSLMPKL